MRGLSILLFLLSFSVYGQVPSGKTMHYTQKEGLSFNIVNSINQDKNGFIWFATGNGLNRFDGINFRTFKSDPGDPAGLPDNYIQNLTRDENGGFWVSSRKGLYNFDVNTERFKHYPVFPGQTKTDVTGVSQNAVGNLWVATSGNGFSYLDKKTGQLKNYTMKSLKGLPSNSILSIQEDPFGILWVGTRDAGLCAFRLNQARIPGQLFSVYNQTPSSRVNAIYRDHFNNMWIATSRGLWFYERKSDTYHVFSAGSHRFTSNVFLSLVEDSDHQLYIGLQEGGLYHLDLNKSEKVTPEDFIFDQVEDENGFNITPRSVQNLFLDRDENLWLGTYGDGSYMVSRMPAKFKQFKKKLVNKSGESYLRYYGMCMDAEGNLWLGTDGDGIYKSRKDGKVLRHYLADGKPYSLTDNAILSAFKDSKNNLWFGTYANGLLRYDHTKDGFISYIHDTRQSGSIAGNDVRVIHEDGQQNIWIGTNGGGLSKLDSQTGKFTNYNMANSRISSNDVRSLEHDEKGNLWIGTYGGGLSYLVIRENKIYPFLQDGRSRINLSGNIIYTLELDRQKRLWIGSEGNGLLVYDTRHKSILKFSEKNGLADNTVYAILEESPGKMWVSTNDGLSSIDLNTKQVYNFSGSDGLQGGQFNAGSAMAGAGGAFMCFGGTEGWNLFYPKTIKPSTFKPQISIIGLQLYGRAGKDKSNLVHVNAGEELTLEANQSVFSIQYAALNYAYPHDAQFAYKLEGLDKDWNYVKRQRSATYRYLQPGTYTFKVMATNQDNIWQENFAAITIHILPPWYKSWWAYTLYSVLVAAVIYGFVHYKSKQAKLKYRIRIANLEAQQERELHESKLSFFTNISHEFRSPLTLIINPVKEMIQDQQTSSDLGNLNIVYRNAKRLLSLIDQLLLFNKAETQSDKLNISRVDLVELCEEVFLCFSYQATKKNITYTFEKANEYTELYADREKIEIALFNLISNALRHTPDGGTVKLSIRESECKVTITVADTGTGIDPKTGNQVFERFYKSQEHHKNYKGGFGIGLFLVKNFVDNHHGKVSFTSVVNEGTTFRIELLKGKQHFKLQSILDHQPESSVMLEELNSFEQEFTELSLAESQEFNQDENALDLQQGILSEKPTLLIIDDNDEIRHYVSSIFKPKFDILEAVNGEDGLLMITRYLPDMIISDVLMQDMDGLALCSLVKADPALNHIPFILLTASSSPETRLKGIEGGADAYVSKPFDKKLLLARVDSLLKSRNNLQTYFYNKITLKSANLKISADYKEFLDRCIDIVEKHITDPNFGISTLADEIGMSRSNLYTKIKSISGQSSNSFIRFIRLRKAAEIFIHTDLTVQETTLLVGIRDARYFREQFYKLFAMNPSDYIKKYRKVFGSKYAVHKSLLKGKEEK